MALARTRSAASVLHLQHTHAELKAYLGGPLHMFYRSISNLSTRPEVIPHLSHPNPASTTQPTLGTAPAGHCAPPQKQSPGGSAAPVLCGRAATCCSGAHCAPAQARAPSLRRGRSAPSPRLPPRHGSHPWGPPPARLPRAAASPPSVLWPRPRRPPLPALRRPLPWLHDVAPRLGGFARG